MSQRPFHPPPPRLPHTKTNLGHLAEMAVGCVEELDGAEVGVRGDGLRGLEARLVEGREEAGRQGNVVGLVEDLGAVAVAGGDAADEGARVGIVQLLAQTARGVAVRGHDNGGDARVVLRNVLQAHVAGGEAGGDGADAGRVWLALHLLVVVDRGVNEKDPMVQVQVAGRRGGRGGLVLGMVERPAQVVRVHLRGDQRVLLAVGQKPRVVAAAQPAVIRHHLAGRVVLRSHVRARLGLTVNEEPGDRR